MNDEFLKKQEKIIDIILDQHEKQKISEEINELSGDIPIPFQLTPRIIFHKIKIFDKYNDFMKWQFEFIKSDNFDVQILNLRYNHDNEVEVHYISGNNELE